MGRPARPVLPRARGGFPAGQPGRPAGERPRGPAGPKEDVSKSLNELETLEVCDRQFTGSATVSELFQHELTQRNPFAALDVCLRAIRVTNGRRSIDGVRLCENKLEAIFPKVINLLCDYQGSDPQTIINTVYDVRHAPTP